MQGHPTILRFLEWVQRQTPTFDFTSGKSLGCLKEMESLKVSMKNTASLGVGDRHETAGCCYMGAGQK